MSLLKFDRDLDFLQDYNHKYVDYLNKYLGKHTISDEESELHSELISKSPKAQRLLGRDGLDTNQLGLAICTTTIKF